MWWEVKLVGVPDLPHLHRARQQGQLEGAHIYHYCRRQGQNAEAADLIEALFERPSM